jgi:hypothetical protein
MLPEEQLSALTARRANITNIMSRAPAFHATLGNFKTKPNKVSANLVWQAVTRGRYSSPRVSSVQSDMHSPELVNLSVMLVLEASSATI